MTTNITHRLADALRQCLTRLEREGIENVHMVDARAVLDVYDAGPTLRTYSLAEIRNGTGWPTGARFALVDYLERNA